MEYPTCHLYFLGIATFHCLTNIKTIQQIKSGIKEIKEDEYTNSLAKDSCLCDVSRGRYSRKHFTQIHKSLYGDAMFVSLRGVQIWRPEANKNICH